MNDDLTAMELELGEADGYGDWEMEDLEDLEDWELEVRRPPRRAAGRPAAVRPARPTMRQRPRPFPGSPMGRPLPGPGPVPPFGGPGPVTRRRRVIRRRPYPGYGPVQTLPPIVVRVRPALVLDRFHFNRHTVRYQHIPQIKQLARRIVASWRTSRPVRTIRLVGHTDNRGPQNYNENLGSLRSRAVGTRLIREINRLQPGLTRRMRIIAQTLGETRPVADNRTAEGRARNRRVQVYLDTN